MQTAPRSRQADIVYRGRCFHSQAGSFPHSTPHPCDTNSLIISSSRAKSKRISALAWRDYRCGVSLKHSEDGYPFGQMREEMEEPNELTPRPRNFLGMRIATLNASLRRDPTPFCGKG
ncbi:hypothetical protein THTE_0941 [Thermogutta terrifontis]|uniref:Uncharacterized protein n=1 Tax=Thermogutta terrifontis TaxID=1331910 RepID=A0A286RC54_9BACT|nr:hypothetical protein THTE_0941 [Thermogutta terrifontis]